MSNVINKLGLPQQVVEVIRSVVGEGRVGLHEPFFIGNEKKYLLECIDSSFVSSVGKYVDRFEQDLCEFTGAKHAVAVVNGTAALHISLLLAGVKPGDEVLIPALTFVATANAVRYCAARPHFIDSDVSSLGVDTQALREYLDNIAEVKGDVCINRNTGNVIRAIVPMHTFGHVGDIEGIENIAEDFCLTLVEDAAESLGSYCKDKHSGTFGLMGVLSFNGNKTITTGGGGAILTDDLEIAKRARHLTTTAKQPHQWEYVHDEVGYNYRLPNINAALGCAQLEQLPNFINAKRELFARYKEAFSPFAGVDVVEEPQNSRSNYWLQAILLDTSMSEQRDLILDVTNSSGVMTRPVWRLLNRLKPYSNYPSMTLSGAESLEKRLINIPSSPQLIMGKDFH